MRRPAAVLLLLALAAARSVAAQTAERAWTDGDPSVLSRDDLYQWVIPRGVRRPAVRDGVLRLEPRTWLHTEESFDDFRLTLSFRVQPGAHAGLFFRSWAQVTPVDLRPLDGYKIVLGTEIDPFRPGTLVGYNRRAHVTREAHVEINPGAWHDLTLDVRNTRAEVSIDGTLVGAIAQIENTFGLVALRGQEGLVEIRDMVLTPLVPRHEPRARRRRDYADLTLGRVVHEPKPAYTADAMRKGINGAALLHVLIDDTGRVADVRVARSLDPVYGLDDAAVAAARQWRFTPCLWRERPTACIVTIEMSFVLKK